MNTGVRLPRKCNRYHDERRVELKVKGKKKTFIRFRLERRR